MGRQDNLKAQGLTLIEARKEIESTQREMTGYPAIGTAGWLGGESARDVDAARGAM